MFRGRSKHTLDTKGRLAIPARFREALEGRGDDRLIVTNFDKCLWAYAWEDWRVIEEKAVNLPESPAASLDACESSQRFEDAVIGSHTFNAPQP